MKLIKSIKIFPKNRKSKSGNMVANIIKIFQKMKSKNYQKKILESMEK